MSDNVLAYGVPSAMDEPVSNKFYPTLSGGTFGGQFGFDWQIGKWFVAGIKYDTDWSGLTGSDATDFTTGNGGQGILRSSEQVNWFGNLLPRLGFLSTNNLLIYGTGGLAFGNISVSANKDYSPYIEYIGSTSSTLPGWAVGGGAEWRMAKHWSLTAEYLYNQLDNLLATATGTTPSGTPVENGYQQQYSFKTNYQTVELGLNCRFSI